MSDKRILSILCLHPNDSYYICGQQRVTRITYETVNYGDHGIGQYNVYKDDQLFATVMHRAIAEINYVQEPAS